MKSKILPILIFLFPFVLNGQTLTGIVTDAKNKPLQYAHVYQNSTQEHVHTNESGKFTIKNISPGDTLLFSHIGYESAVLIIENTSGELRVILNESSILIEEVVISPEINSINLFSKIDLQINPVNSSQEVLRKVPGLFIGQHAGGGKAEQIFLRGFDIDHGTDINITVDGLPVNMVSHAHGQGYADLHFLIPETIDKIDFGKGPYHADQGNFTTAGFVNFETKEILNNSAIQLEFGQFNSFRTLGLFNVINNENHSAYLASEYILTDGPFESPQNFNRLNIMGKYTARLPNQDKVSVLASHFDSQWDASGQIPERAVKDGSISRFGAIDDTEGGYTDRTNFALSYDKNISNNTFIKNTVFYSLYDFELYSNFTFFLDDPVNGDQIRQKENRQIFGAKSEWNHSLDFNKTNGLLQIGIGLRNDKSLENELSNTVNRITTLDSTQLGNINETNLFGYLNANFDFGKWIVNPAVRFDFFKFNYNDLLTPAYKTLSVDKAIASPKLNILYNHSGHLQFYLKMGMGFHSNDTRVVVAQDGKEILPAAYGSDIGLIWKPIPKLIVNAAAWYLFLEQEFVYVGDAGIVEPSGKSQRMGLDFGLRYQLNTWLFLDADVNYAYARAVDEPEGADLIPLAPPLTSTGGLSIRHPNGFYGGVRYRYLSDRPANEDNSIVARGYFVTDLNAGYQWKNLDFGITIENLLNTEWNETQFATESRLYDEPESVEEIHFTPGTPFFIKGSIRYLF